MMKFIIFISIVLIQNLAQAGAFGFEKSNCSVASTGNNLKFEVEGNSFTTKVDVALLFSGEPVAFPKLRVTFYEHFPSGVTVRWKDIITARKNLNQFRDEISTRVQGEEGKAFEFTFVSGPENGVVYESKPLTMERAQDMVALFLSQNELELSLPSPEGLEWTTKLQLQSSDSAYRQMAQSCYPSLTTEFLKDGGERKPIAAQDGFSGVAIHWSEGYGLTNFTSVKAHLPPLLQSVEIPFDENYSKKVGELLVLTNEKRATVQSLNAALSDPQYLELENQLSVSYSQLDSVYNRFMAITGSSDQGLLAQKRADQERLLKAISDVSLQIEQLTAAQASQTQLVSEAAASLEPFMNQLQTYNDSISQRVQRVEEIKSLLERTTALFYENQNLLTDRGLADVSVAAEGPWSVEEIERRHQENTDLSRKIQTVVLLKELLESLASELPVLVEKAQAHEAAFVAFNKAVGDEAAFQRQISMEKSWFDSQEPVPNMGAQARARFFDLNGAVEAEMATIFVNGKVRDYQGEFDYHSSSYKKLEEQYLSLKSQLSSSGSLAAKILCGTELLFNGNIRKSNCLTAEEIRDERIVEAYIEALPPKDADAYLVNVEKPWAQSATKTQILLAQAQKELSNLSPELNTMLETWLRMRHLIWRWFLMQKEAKALDVCGAGFSTDLLGQSVYSAAYYSKIFECEAAIEATHSSARDQAVAGIAALQPTMEQLRIARDTADAEFSQLSAQFVNVSMKRLSNVGEQGDMTKLFTDCILPLKAAEACSASITSGAQSAQAAIDQQNAIYLNTVRALIVNIDARNQQLNTESTVLASEIESVRTELSTYQQQNNIEALQAQKAQLEQQLALTNQAIVDSTFSKEQYQVDLTQAVQGEAQLETEAQSLATQLQERVASIREILPAYQPHCAKILPGANRLQELDKSIYALLAPETTMEHSDKIYSSCQRSSLEDYLPEPTSRVVTPPMKMN